MNKKKIIKLGIVGIAGKMGQAITRLALQDPRISVKAGKESPNHKLLGKDIGTRNLTCSGFELELESAVSESTRLDVDLKSLGAKCDGGLLMGDKHGGVNLYIVDTSSVDVGLELEGTKSAKSTACSSKLKLDASFSGDLELTLNLFVIV